MNYICRKGFLKLEKKRDIVYCRYDREPCYFNGMNFKSEAILKCESIKDFERSERLKQLEKFPLLEDILKRGD